MKPTPDKKTDRKIQDLAQYLYAAQYPVFFTGAGLMSANLKGADSTSLKIECSGPIRGLAAEANAFREVRGFLENVPIPIDKSMQDFDLGNMYPNFLKI